MKCEEIVKTFEVIKKSGELVFEHYKARSLKNTLIEVGIKNIIGMCDTALEQIAAERDEGKEGLPTVINSRFVDYCLECWNKMKNMRFAREKVKGMIRNPILLCIA